MTLISDWPTDSDTRSRLALIAALIEAGARPQDLGDLIPLFAWAPSEDYRQPDYWTAQDGGKDLFSVRVDFEVSTFELLSKLKRIAGFEWRDCMAAAGVETGKGVAAAKLGSKATSRACGSVAQIAVKVTHKAPAPPAWTLPKIEPAPEW